MFEFGKDFIAKGLKPPDGDTGTGNPAQWVPHQFALVTTRCQGRYLLFVWFYAISVLAPAAEPGHGGTPLEEIARQVARLRARIVCPAFLSGVSTGGK